MSKLIFNRENPVYKDRAQQIYLNSLAVSGGRPYIDARLVRSPNESDISWTGKNSSTNLGSGRKDRAVYINDAGRISQKINSYIFSELTERETSDPDFIADVTKSGLSINQYFYDVSESLTTAGWVWLCVDKGAPQIDPQTGEAMIRSVAEARNDRVYWSYYPALSVPDWSFDSNGNLKWLITEDKLYDNSDPTKEGRYLKTRTLWESNPLGATYKQFVETRKGINVINYGSISLPYIPFILVGNICSKPCWFDDVELINAQLMNLDSLHTENLIRTVFPQLVIGSQMLENIETKLVERSGSSNGSRIIELVREVVRGLDNPIIESSDENGITRFIVPGASDLDAIPTEIKRKRNLLFDSVGLSLFNKETRQIQTAESKAFDHLDTEHTLRTRVNKLEEAEVKLIKLSKALDNNFNTWEPKWNRSFSVPDIKESVDALQKISSLITDESQRDAYKTALNSLLKNLRS